MEVNEYTLRNTGELEGELELVIEHEGEEYRLDFEFQKHGTPPHSYSPFPSGNKEIYAWPVEPIPDELKFDVGSEEAKAALLGGIGLPDSFNLLPEPYDDVDSGNRSPFVIYNA
jgi:hypothetical protein